MQIRRCRGSCRSGAAGVHADQALQELMQTMRSTCTDQALKGLCRSGANGLKQIRHRKDPCPCRSSAAWAHVSRATLGHMQIRRYRRPLEGAAPMPPRALRQVSSMSALENEPRTLQSPCPGQWGEPPRPQRSMPSAPALDTGGGHPRPHRSMVSAPALPNWGDAPKLH